MGEVVIGNATETAQEAAAPRGNEVVFSGAQDAEPEQKAENTPPAKPEGAEAKPEAPEGKPDGGTKPEGGDATEGKDGKEPEEGAFEVGDCDMSELAKEYAETGKLSDESYAELAENGFSRDLVDTYIAGVKAQQSQGQEMGEKAQEEIYSVAGGEKGYSDLISWAETKLTATEKEAYNKVIATGDKEIIKLAVSGLVYKYEQTYGRNPKLIQSGRTAPEEPKGFASDFEMKQAMGDKRYGRDPQYTREVEKKVINSSFLSTKGRH